ILRCVGPADAEKRPLPGDRYAQLVAGRLADESLVTLASAPRRARVEPVVEVVPGLVPRPEGTRRRAAPRHRELRDGGGHLAAGRAAPREDGRLPPDDVVELDDLPAGLARRGPREEAAVLGERGDPPGRRRKRADARRGAHRRYGGQSDHGDSQDNTHGATMRPRCEPRVSARTAPPGPGRHRRTTWPARTGRRAGAARGAPSRRGAPRSCPAHGPARGRRRSGSPAPGRDPARG